MDMVCGPIVLRLFYAARDNTMTWHISIGGSWVPLPRQDRESVLKLIEVFEEEGT